MKKKISKLQLNKETLRGLEVNSEKFREVAGGGNTVYTCGLPYFNSCVICVEY